MLILRDIGWILAVIIKFELEFGSGQRESSRSVPSLSQDSRNLEKTTERLGQRSLVFWIIDHILRRIIVERLSRSNERLSKRGLHWEQSLTINLPYH